MSLKAAIAGVGAYRPGCPVTTEDIHRKIYDTTGYRVKNALVERLTGVRTRHYRGSDEQSSDLAVNAAVCAMERAGVSVEEIDLLIFAACSQDVTEPATANIVQEKLGAKNAQVLDVKNACNSFLSALDVADSHIRAGKSQRALVTVGETLSLGIDWNIRSSADVKSRIGSLTLGDAGGAVVLEGVPAEEGRGLLATGFRSYGEKWRLATVLSGGSMYRFSEEHSFFRCQPKGLRDAAYELIPNIVKEVLDSVGWKAEDVDLCCGHQVTKEMICGLSKRIGIPTGRQMVTVTECGNTAAASIPLCLDQAYEQGRLTRGAKVLLVGGAAGFSVGVVPLIL